MNGKKTGNRLMTKYSKSGSQTSATYQRGSFCRAPMEEKRRKKNKYGLPDPILPIRY